MAASLCALVLSASEAGSSVNFFETSAGSGSETSTGSGVVEVEWL